MIKTVTAMFSLPKNQNNNTSETDRLVASYVLEALYNGKTLYKCNKADIETYFNGEADKKELIVNAFSWASSPSGMAYWSDISCKWRKFIEDELRETA